MHFCARTLFVKKKHGRALQKCANFDMICLHDMTFFIPLYGIGGGDPAVVRKELSDVLKHEIFRSGSVLRSTFFTILSLLLAAKKYVGEHYMDSTLSLDGTAAQLGISPSYLSRIFSEVDGKRFTQYLSDLRIEQAKRLLADESKLVRDVGQEVGFLTVQNFMRVFKSKTGVTPSEYRSTLPRKS